MTLTKTVLYALTHPSFQTTKCPSNPLVKIPSSYSTVMTMNIQMGNMPGKSISIYEAADNNAMKALITTFTQIDVIINNETVPELLEETMLWNPELSGINEFLNIYTRDENGKQGDFCGADALKPNSFMQWMFGYKPGQGVKLSVLQFYLYFNHGFNIGFPGVASMIHFADASYVSGCPTVIRGIKEMMNYALNNIS